MIITCADFSGWSWSLWFTFNVSGFSSSICCWWRYADVYCNRHGCALWGKWGGLLFKVMFILLLAIILFDWWTELLTIAIHTRYGSYPLRGKYCHEMALRIVLACIEVCMHNAEALFKENRYKLYSLDKLLLRGVLIISSAWNHTNIWELFGLSDIWYLATCAMI